MNTVRLGSVARQQLSLEVAGKLRRLHRPTFVLPQSVMEEAEDGAMEEDVAVAVQELPSLTQSMHHALTLQDSRAPLSTFHQNKLELEASKNWDKFYKRNGTRFFKDRHWTTREFLDLIGDGKSTRSLLEVGCGVGNFLYPLLEESQDLFIYACDFSPRAVQFVRDHPSFDQSRVQAFVCDLTTDDLQESVGAQVDIISMIFVLSAIHPDKFGGVAANLGRVLRPGGVLLFRDYARYDMAMLRFRPGSKLSDNFYVRQDGTRAYYFTKQELEGLFSAAGLVVESSQYVLRRTVNKKEAVDAQRIFIQCKVRKPWD